MADSVCKLEVHVRFLVVLSCECETCLVGLGKGGRNKAATPPIPREAAVSSSDRRRAWKSLPCVALAPARAKSSVLQSHWADANKGDPQSRRSCRGCSLVDQFEHGIGVPTTKVCPRWRANWDVLIKRGKRGLLTFYDVKEGGLGEGGAKERGEVSGI